MYTKCPMTKLMKNYQFFTFWWFKSLCLALTNMSWFHHMSVDEKCVYMLQIKQHLVDMSAAKLFLKEEKHFITNIYKVLYFLLKKGKHYRSNI